MNRKRNGAVGEVNTNKNKNTDTDMDMFPAALGCLFVFALSSALLTRGQSDEDDWIDPYDMINYDATTKTMRSPPEERSFGNVPTRRRQFVQDPALDAPCPDVDECNSKVQRLQKEIQDHKWRIASASQASNCNPIFRRFLSKLLKEIRKLGLPGDDPGGEYYDAKVKLTKQSVEEIQKLIDGDESWRTGALDDALSPVLVDFKPHDYEAWKWRFEDTFGVELDTVLKVFLSVFVLVVVICTELWSVVSWFVQFRRLFAICFFISIVWNWFYLYKIAFAEHQTQIIKMESINEKCTGVKQIDWKDNLREWFRSTWTLQDDPCKRYYEVLMVNPILLVPPTKAISVTLTTFITEPLKHFGQGISEFLRALLKDLPVTLQIPVLLTIVLSILVFFYGGVNAAFQHGIMAPFQRRRRDPPGPPQVQSRRRVPQLQDEDIESDTGAEDVPQPRRPVVHRLGGGDAGRAHVRQRRPAKHQEVRHRVYVETLRNADRVYSEDDTDSFQRENGFIVTEEEEMLDDGARAEPVLDPKDEVEKKNLQPTEKEKISKDAKLTSRESPSESERTNIWTEQNAGPTPSGLDADVTEVPVKTMSLSRGPVENVGLSVQETSHC
ncbi:chloride channel CLIC-like protein 1 [Denticeps clupeoides]|uniref:Chloride channel CLIC-like protein 1 n=1 Tax=Denticeps clupeoides TaxID=299321 RepID=A0AAY4EXH8_9TELE|nr:chloride channel CLIC-like protein 1 [Denticeps clupeoides]